MNATERYQQWLQSPQVDEKTKEELRTIQDQPEEIESRFYDCMSFGTAGLRGTMKNGTMHMNRYMVRYATQAMANLLLETPDGAERGVVIAHDSRHHSDEFASDAAAVLAANGIKVYLFNGLRPTPELSFAVRHLRAKAGINITASHNPKEYNGYKAYWEDGAQLAPSQSDKVSAAMAAMDLFEDVKVADLDEAIDNDQVLMIGQAVDEAYIQCVLNEIIDTNCIKNCPGFRVVYTAFHGAGAKIVPEVLRRAGVSMIHTVPQQQVPNGDFPTMEQPNPEYPEGFTLAIRMAKETHGDIVIGTDPDSDRIGVAVRRESGEYSHLTGNQLGILLTEYVMCVSRRTGKMPANPMVISTIVTSRMIEEMCKGFGVYYKETFTGFKHIGLAMKEEEEKGEHQFLFGFEESYGYLKGTYCRDKDAVVAAALVCEMACHYKKRGMTLFDALENLYRRYGYFGEQTYSLQMEGMAGKQQMDEILEKLRSEPPKQLGQLEVESFTDYKTGVRHHLQESTTEENVMGQLRSNVLSFQFVGGDELVIRPSGTEPKLKCYVLVKGDNPWNRDRKLADIWQQAQKLLK